MRKQTHAEIVSGWHPFTSEEIERYVSKGFWQNLTVGDILDRNAANLSDKLAIADDSVEVTWAQLKQKADRMALHFKKLGLEYGDFVVLQTPNVVAFFYLVLGLARIGAIPIMCLPRHRKLEISHQIGLHKAKAIVVPLGEKFDYAGMVEEICNDHPHLKLFLSMGGRPNDRWVSIDELLENDIESTCPEDYLDQFRPDPNDIFIEQLSGGTTGVPKGIPRTHNESICQWDYDARPFGVTDESVNLLVTPIAHNISLATIAGPMFFRGGTTIITKRVRPEDHFRLIEKYGVTHVSFVPVLIVYWMEAEEERKKYDLGSLKVISAGGQKIKAELVRWCLAELGAHFVNHYGMAEGIHMATRWENSIEIQSNTVGKPVIQDRCVEIRLVDESNEQVAAGEIGEAVIRGLGIFKGYFRSPEENAQCFDAQGFFHTGDLMSIREDGRYVVEGRKKDMVIRGGENIYPEPVEGWLMKHPKIKNTAVVGIPDFRLGERLCAFVQLREGQTLTFEEVKQHLSEQGAALFQWPERLEIVAGWPLTAVNKIDKRRLRAYITAKLVQEGEITRAFGDDYLLRDKLTVENILKGSFTIDFTGEPQ